VTQPQENFLETILVVEDHPIVLQAVTEILERAGFCVLATSSGEQAIQVENTTEQTIHLLLSDVMMPDMSGPAIAQILKKHRPDMRVMLMSGYSHGDMLFLNHGWHFIEKPFLSHQLVARVNEVLHTPERSQGDDHFDNRIKSEGTHTS
jgi:DNA-binding NtrC family response regulator